LFLVFSLLTINCAYLNRVEEKRESRRKKHGANLIIQKINGQQTGGELIVVKQDSLLLLNTEGKDVSVDIDDIKVIRVVKKSKKWIGAAVGFLIVGGIGALIVNSSGWSSEILTEKDFIILFGGLGAGIGALIGIEEGRDKKIQIEGMTDLEIQKTLDKLRKKARVRDYK
jgi:hypothetical protein